MKDVFKKLLSVKSIVTLSMTAALIAMLLGNIEPNEKLVALFCTSYGAVITYFFTRKENNDDK
ncbi:MAG: hypothetical protein IJS65_08285 [Clostridia bacterium]|nr:hypothetical protein [Clostridia bacterium]